MLRPNKVPYAGSGTRYKGTKRGESSSRATRAQQGSRESSKSFRGGRADEALKMDASMMGHTTGRHRMGAASASALEPEPSQQLDAQVVCRFGRSVDASVPLLLLHGK